MPTIERCELVSKIVTYSVITLLGTAIIVVAIISVAPRTEVYDCSAPYPPYNVWFTNYGGGTVKVSWYTDWTHQECETTFLLMYTYDGQITYDTSYEDFAIVRDLYICSRLEIRIWAVNKWGDRSPYYTDTHFLVIPENQTITDIAVNEIIDYGALLRWSKPENLTNCDVTYLIRYSSEFGIETNTTGDSQLIIPHEGYCFHLYIHITLFVDSEFNSVTSYDYTTEVTIEGQKFQVSADDPEELIVTWDSYAKEEMCSVTYIATYDTMNAANAKVITTNTPEARFRFVYCEEAWLNTQIAIVYYDIINSTNGIVAATQYPESITDYDAIGLDYTSSEDMLIITWQPWQSDPLTQHCDVHYQVKITTDFDTYTYINATPPIEFSNDLYCFHVSLEIQVFVGEVPVGDPVVVSYDASLGPVEDLKLTQSMEPNTLLATWNDVERKEQCGIEYEVTFGYDYSYKTVKTNEPYFTFDAVSCTTMFIRVVAVSGTRKSELRSATYGEGIPKNQTIRITDITSTVVAEGLLITWSIPPELNQCNVMYMIRYFTEVGIRDAAAVDSQLLIPHWDYCFHVNILINLFVNYYEFISESSYNYNAEVTLEGQKIEISPDDPEELIITWDSNAKEEVCSVRYVVTYDTINATVPEVITTTTPEARFRFVDCEEAWVTTQMRIFNGDTINFSNGMVDATQCTEN